MTNVADWFEGFGIGVVLTTAILVLIVGVLLGFQSPQVSYEQMHKGEVACVDTPDDKVYCYPVKK